MKILSAIVLVMLVGELSRGDDTIPTPSVARIDYSRPQDYVVLHESFGDASRIRKIAEKLRTKTPETSLVAIHRWIAEHLRYDGGAAYKWRNFDELVNSGRYGGCADYALVFAALARACDIPAVFVKTLDVEWIVNYRQQGIEDSWSGHVFLEVYAGGRWRLLDPQARVLYEDYDPNMRLLPGFRYAYDKGSDPRELVLSIDWERWKQQTAAHFSRFDLNELFQPTVLPPVGSGKKLRSNGDVYIAADSPIWQALGERCSALGLSVQMAFNTEFERYLAECRGNLLVITCVGRHIVLPKERYEQFLPLAETDVYARTTKGVSGIESRQLEDGTRVVLLYAQSVDQMLDVVRNLGKDDLPKP